MQKISFGTAKQPRVLSDSRGAGRTKSQQPSQAAQEENYPMHQHPREATQNALQTLINLSLMNACCFPGCLSLPLLTSDRQGTEDAASHSWMLLGCNGHRAAPGSCITCPSSVPLSSLQGHTTHGTASNSLMINLQSSLRPQ